VLSSFSLREGFWTARLQNLDESSGGELNTESEGSDSDSDDSASDVSLA
jgi:hypothetical protein